MDHVAFTVSDLDACVDFLIHEMGAVPCYREGPIARGPWMQQRLGVPADAVAQIAMLTIGGINLELFSYHSAHASPTPPPLRNAGTAQLRVSVADLTQARTRARAAGMLREGADGETLIAAYGLTLRLVSSAPAETTADYLGVGTYGVISVRAVEFYVDDLAGILSAFEVIAGTDVVRRLRVPEDEGTPERGSAALRLSCGPAIIVHPAATKGAASTPEPVPVTPTATMGAPDAPVKPRPASSISFPGSTSASPRNCDVGGHHIAFAVARPADVDAALSHLGSGFTVMGSQPETIEDGPLVGDRWIYVYARAGLQMEILHMPDGALPYEQLTSARRVSAQPATAQR